VVCLCETFLISFDSAKYYFADFDVYIAPAKKLSHQGRCSGGVICMVRKALSNFVQLASCSYQNIVVMQMSRELFGCERNVLLVCAYVPPQGSVFYELDGIEVNNGIEYVETCMLELGLEYGDVDWLLCGDFNARTANLNPSCNFDVNNMNDDVFVESRYSQDGVVNVFGRSLLQLAVAYGLTLLNGYDGCERSGCYTYVSIHGSSTIDYFVMSDCLLRCSPDVKIILSEVSPHMPIEMRINCLTVNEVTSDKRNCIEKFVWNENEALEFVQNLTHSLQNECSQMFLPPNVDLPIDHATNVLSKCITESAESMKKSFIHTPHRKRIPSWFDDDCKKFRKRVRNLLQKYYRTKRDSDRDLYVETRRDYKSLLRKRKVEHKKNMAGRLSDTFRNPKLFWQQVKYVSGGRQMIRNNIKIETWLDHFKSVYEKDSRDEHIECKRDYIEDGCTSDLNDFITHEEIMCALYKIKVGKSAGPDNIIGEMLKYSKHVLLPYLSILFNAIFRTGHFPQNWADSIIVPLHKKGDPNNPDNYRAISLTSILSKVFTHILKVRLEEWSLHRNILLEEQAGFRKGFSTIDNVFILRAVAQKYLHRKRKLYVAFVDFRKAFDSVNRSALWKILQGYDIRGNMYNILVSMYCSVKSCVRNNGDLTEYFACTSGVKQGCVLSPLLFSFVINSLASAVIENGKHGVQLKPDVTQLFMLMFADDVALISDTAIGLQNQLYTLCHVGRTLGLTVNTNKTRVVVFRLGGHLANHEKWYIDGQKVEVVNQYKYLGLVMSTKICTNTLLSELASRAKAATIQIIRSINKIQCFSPNVFFKMFDAQVQPLLLYGAEIWGVDNCDVIEGVHLFALKRFLNVSMQTPNSMVYGETGRHPLQINAMTRSVKYWLTIQSMDDSRYPKKVCKMLLAECESGHTNWAAKIRNILFQYGFASVWQQQNVDNVKSFLYALKTKAMERFNQIWLDKICESGRYDVYKMLKKEKAISRYLYVLDRKVFRDVYIRFRLGISDILSHKLRYHAYEADSFKCPICKSSPETDAHFLLICPGYKELRDKYLCTDNGKDVEANFSCLMTDENSGNIRNVSRFLYHAFKHRNYCLTRAQNVVKLVVN